jgi:hypothetical protein
MQVESAVMTPRQAEVSARTVAIDRRGGIIARVRSNATDEQLVVALAAILSIGFFIWYDAHGLTSAFNDARIREIIARRVVVSRTPGLAQFGTTWLPLPSIFMLSLIWNDALFRSGIAGAIPSMLGYVVASFYLYRIGRLVTSSRGAGWVAACVFMLNPSVLYMQGTAMSEIISISAIIVAIYYALNLMRTSHAADLTKCAAAVGAGTLIRYENWVLAFVFAPIVAVAAWRLRGRALAEAWTILYGLLAFAGCAAWVVYNAVIFHDPLLSFYYGQTSHTYYADTPDYQLPARHHPWMAFKMYELTVVGTVGWLLLGLALFGLVVCLWRFRLRLRTLPIYFFLFPFGFYWLVLYRGINTETLPELGQGPYYNVRFGLLMVPAVAVFLAVLVTAARATVRRVLVAIVLIAIVLSSVVEFQQTPLTVREAQVNADQARTGQEQAKWFSSRFKGGAVLITYVNDSTAIFYMLTKHDLPDRAFITDANGAQFDDALAHPESTVKWIFMNSDDSNGESRIFTTLNKRNNWRAYFALRASFGTTRIYQRV